MCAVVVSVERSCETQAPVHFRASDDLDALQAALKAGASRAEDRDALGYTVLMRAADDGAIVHGVEQRIRALGLHAGT